MKTQLTITRADPSHNVYGAPQDTFTVMINPEQVQHQQMVVYDKTLVPKQERQNNRFAGIGQDRVSFEIVLDATGVVRQDVEDDSITVQLRKLRRIVYQFDTETPQPNHVRLLWGTFLFFGQLLSMGTSYTLFAPSGEPLRAKISFAFAGAVRDGIAELRINSNNDNVVRVVSVRQGDSLPLLCESVYGDASCYLDVADHNDLDQIEPLEVGRTLEMPARASK